ncbi:hypothetical protein E2986_12471 [Frieseomelitta varia]|uniref:Uncharacterized protein n=1 Tax=Frieseomelitta varia TaxID=561572 RepID=A0A833S2L1_9HYME|nr:FMRFamide-related peptides-like [Frieseomelitta varia]KAF3423605.1 hypothetical protein E2986_12471 [Frieseomelitta varia]
MKSSLLYVLPFICNCVSVSPSILTNDGGLRIFKNTPDEFQYILGRNSDEADSKERRSNMGSSFIRYGRSDPVGNVEKVFSSDNDGSSKVNRYPRWKSPDIVIRFGRSDFKNGDRDYKRGKSYLNFIRYGRNVHVYPVEVDMTALCSDLLSNEIKELQPYDAKLLHLCDILNNIDVEHRNNLDFLENRFDSKHD